MIPKSDSKWSIFWTPLAIAGKKPKLNQLRDDVTLHKFINSLTLYYQSHFMCSHKSENYTYCIVHFSEPTGV